MGKNKGQSFKRKAEEMTPASSSSSSPSPRESLTDWVAALAQKEAAAQKTTASAADASAILPSKAERIAKRQAKRIKKEEAMQQKLQLRRRQQEHQQQQQKQQQQQPDRNGRRPAKQSHSANHARREAYLQQISSLWADLVAAHSAQKRQSHHSQHPLDERTAQATKKPRVPIVETSDRKPRNYPHSVHHRKSAHTKTNMASTTILQPRPRDYGGLGLARPTLYLPFADPSWIPRLQEVFAEHIAGWSGKPPMAQAMKKQRDSNLLWRRLQREKANHGKIQRKKFGTTMSVDERVEALLKSSDGLM